MVKHFSDSENPRVIKLNEMKRDQSWREKSADIKIGTFKTKAECRVDGTEHMTSDGKRLFVAECWEIFVIDAETLELLRRLDVRPQNAIGSPPMIRMETDGNFLVAFIRYDK